MRTILYILVLTLLSGCGQKISYEDVELLNGYWEIEKVELPNSQEKKYTINKDIDYIEIKKNKGFRQKVVQQFDATFLTNSIKEDLTVFDSIGKKFIKYQTKHAHWTEQIVKINQKELVIKNVNEIYYFYKKYEPLKF